jgi:hypothetical protein
VALAVKYLTYRAYAERSRNSWDDLSRAPGDYRLPIKNHEGLFLDGFKACAWRDWEPKKRAPAKPQEVYGKKGISTPSATSKSAACPASKSADIELMPCMGQVFSYRDMERTARQRIAGQAAQIVFRRKRCAPKSDVTSESKIRVASWAATIFFN